MSDKFDYEPTTLSGGGGGIDGSQTTCTSLGANREGETVHMSKAQIS